MAAAVAAATISCSEMLSLLPPSLVAGKAFGLYRLGTLSREFPIRGSCLNESYRALSAQEDNWFHWPHIGTAQEVEKKIWWDQDQNNPQPLLLGC